MRWSLILSTFIAVQSAFYVICVALAVPSSWDQLERRARTRVKVKSSVYRKNAELHPYKYHVNSETGGVTRQKLEPQYRLHSGKKLLVIKKTDADHVFEHQMLTEHLGKHGLKFDKLDSKLQNQVKRIMNGPRNVVPISSSINRGKGQLIKHGLKGKSITPKKSRDGYTLLSYPTAKRTAKKLDNVFNKAYEGKEHIYNPSSERGTFQKTLRSTMENAKLLTPGQPSPATTDSDSSRSSSQSSSPNSSPAKPGSSSKSNGK